MHGVPVGQHFADGAIFGAIPLSGGGGFVTAGEEEAPFGIAGIREGAGGGEKDGRKQDFFHGRTRCDRSLTEGPSWRALMIVNIGRDFG
ncbi:MAG TPA: hypothetical protein DC058_09000 [Planctomycetaceae bacterium]|nr:hypothetical protein [Planctomycetaceae bacterium]